MQLLRDNLTLWTSSDGNEPEAAGDASKEAEKAPETETKPGSAAEEPAPTAA